MRVIISLFCLSFIVLITTAQEINIIPQPASLQVKNGVFTLTPSTQIISEGSGLENSVNFINWYLNEYYGFQLTKEKSSQRSNAIILNFERMDNALPGAYSLEVNKDNILINGDNEEGVFYGMQTLIQLLPVSNLKLQTSNLKPQTLQIPFVAIKDAPRFAYRGMHLDVGRHFFPVAFIKKYIDYIALHKMNYFHWHLTEDQGWRIEIKQYPALTQVGAYRNGTLIGRYPGTGNTNIRYGGFYTQDEIKDIVKYATERYIIVVPEIELPGHSSAAIASYPWLSCFPDEPTKITTAKSETSFLHQAQGNKKLVQETWGVFDDVFCAGKDSTFLFLQNVMDEVLSLFPSKYIHVGGDECPKSNWKRCPNCQKRIKDEKLKDEHELQSYFIQRMEKYLNSKGRTLIGWDEILEGGLAPKAVVMSWRGEAGGIAAAKQNHDVIMTPEPYVYFNYSQATHEDSLTYGGYTPVEKAYNYEPVPKELNKEMEKYVTGAQGNVWTEYIYYPTTVEYQIFPRMSALSEVLWTPKEKKNWPGFEKRLITHFKRYDLWKSHYSTAYYDIVPAVSLAPGNNGLLVKFETKDKAGRLLYGISGKHFQKSYTTPVLIKQSEEITGMYYRNDKLLDSITISIKFNKATGKKIRLKEEPSQKYRGHGAFTLVDGIQNKKGISQSAEFLGFNGTDCEAVIDLGTKQEISNVKLHVLQQQGSWIYRPKYVEVFSSRDGKTFSTVGMTEDVSTDKGNGIMEIKFSPTPARYVKVLVKNWGVIGQGNPGAGNKAWLLVDEIELN